MTIYVAVSLLGVVVLLFLALSVYNDLMTKRWLQEPDARGRMVSIGDRSLYVTVKGTGSPVIVIEGDIGSSSPEWWKIQDELSQLTRVVAYDRAGYGWSDYADDDRSASDIAEDLSSLLEALHIDGPLILVGHGAGALYLRYYSCMHPDRVRAAVFIEPLSPEFRHFKEKLKPAFYNNLIDKRAAYKITRVLAQYGIIRIFKIVPYATAPEHVKHHITENYSKTSTSDVMIREYVAGLKGSYMQVEECASFPQVPLFVIRHSSERYKNYLLAFRLSLDEAQFVESLWMDMHTGVAGLSSKGKMISAQRSLYNIHLEEPETIVRSVRQIMNRQ